MCGRKDRVASFLSLLEKQNFPREKLSQLPSFQLLRNKMNTNSLISEKPQNWKFGIGAFLFLLFCLLGILCSNGWFTKEEVARLWFRWNSRNEFHEKCIIGVSSAMKTILRPATHCDMCQPIQYVDRVASLSPEEFERKYAYSGRPVIITDAQQNWTAQSEFSFDFFKKVYGSDSPALDNYERGCQFFPYRTDFKSLREVFNMSVERASLKGEPWYIGWSNCDSAVTNVLRQYYQRPYFLPHNSESSKTDWIFMGAPGYGAHMHVDHVVNPSWQAQIRGKKQWNLEPPPECYFKCQPLEVVLEQGETIVLDTNIWLHKTLIVSDEISVTIGSEYD